MWSFIKNNTKISVDNHDHDQCYLGLFKNRNRLAKTKNISFLFSYKGSKTRQESHKIRPKFKSLRFTENKRLGVVSCQFLDAIASLEWGYESNYVWRIIKPIFCQKPMLDAVISIRLWVMFVCRVTVLFLKPGENQCSKKENSDWHWRLLDIFFTCVYQSISYPDG